MKRKTRNLLWLSLLFVLSFLLGAEGVYASDPGVPKNEFPIFVIMLGVALFIIFGAISMIVYFILRKKKINDPSKISLIVFSSLMFLGLMGNLSKAMEGVHRRNLMENRDELLSGIRAGFMNELKKQAAADPAVAAQLKGKENEICDCIINLMKYDYDLLEEIDNSSDPKNMAANSPKIMQILSYCFDASMGDTTATD